MSTTQQLATDLRRWGERAIEAAKAGDLATSLSLCADMIRDAPSNAIGLRTRADAYCISGDKHRACQDLRQAIASGIAPVADYCKLGYWLLALRQFEEARRTAEDALSRADEEELAFLGEAFRMIAAYAALNAGERDIALHHAQQCATDAEDYFDGRMISRDEIIERASRLP